MLITSAESKAYGKWAFLTTEGVELIMNLFNVHNQLILKSFKVIASSQGPSITRRLVLVL